jgi:hypothetical protein
MCCCAAPLHIATPMDLLSTKPATPRGSTDRLRKLLVASLPFDTTALGSLWQAKRNLVRLIANPTRAVTTFCHRYSDGRRLSGSSVWRNLHGEKEVTSIVAIWVIGHRLGGPGLCHRHNPLVNGRLLHWARASRDARISRKVVTAPTPSERPPREAGQIQMQLFSPFSIDTRWPAR